MSSWADDVRFLRGVREVDPDEFSQRMFLDELEARIPALQAEGLTDEQILVRLLGGLDVTDPMCTCGHPRSEHDSYIGCITQPGLCPCLDFTPRLKVVTDDDP